ncbi:MAG TPA: hypothetical protein VEN79_00160 [Terriglobia bacterium]|nr:hypothetical protein [Terriglobia bacterium]
MIGKHDYDRLELIILQPLEYVDAASSWHADVQDYDVGFRQTDLPGRVRSVVRVADNLYTRYLPQAGPQALNEYFRIIHN